MLLLDELDSIAKRRDDARDVGELKHLVSVILQEIVDYPATGLLICRDQPRRSLGPGGMAPLRDAGGVPHADGRSGSTSHRNIPRIEQGVRRRPDVVPKHDAREATNEHGFT